MIIVYITAPYWKQHQTSRLVQEEQKATVHEYMDLAVRSCTEELPTSDSMWPQTTILMAHSNC